MAFFIIYINYTFFYILIVSNSKLPDEKKITDFAPAYISYWMSFYFLTIPCHVYFLNLRFAWNWPSLSLHSAAKKKKIMEPKQDIDLWFWPKNIKTHKKLAHIHYCQWNIKLWKQRKSPQGREDFYIHCVQNIVKMGETETKLTGFIIAFFINSLHHVAQ